jgi:hypothetical protein
MDTPLHRCRRASAAALAVAAALTACGGDGVSDEATTAAVPTLPRALAEELALASDDVAELLEAGDGCAASERAGELRELTLAAVESGEVPARLEEPLVTAVEDLAGAIVCEPATTEDEDDGEEDDPGKGKAEGKDKDRDKDKGEDGEGNQDVTTGETGTTETDTVATTTTEEG